MDFLIFKPLKAVLPAVAVLFLDVEGHSAVRGKITEIIQRDKPIRIGQLLQGAKQIEPRGQRISGSTDQALQRSSILMPMNIEKTFLELLKSPVSRSSHQKQDDSVKEFRRPGSLLAVKIGGAEREEGADEPAILTSAYPNTRPKKFESRETQTDRVSGKLAARAVPDLKIVNLDQMAQSGPIKIIVGNTSYIFQPQGSLGLAESLTRLPTGGSQNGAFNSLGAKKTTATLTNKVARRSLDKVVGFKYSTPLANFGESKDAKIIVVEFGSANPCNSTDTSRKATRYISGVNVSIVGLNDPITGTNLAGVTNAVGEPSLSGNDDSLQAGGDRNLFRLPNGSRFVVRVEDPENVYLPTMVEGHNINEGSSPSCTPVYLQSPKDYEGLAALSDTPIHNHSSLCGLVFRDGEPFGDARVRIGNLEPDTIEAGATEELNLNKEAVRFPWFKYRGQDYRRFCFLHIDQPIVELDVEDEEGEIVGSFVVPLNGDPEKNGDHVVDYFYLDSKPADIPLNLLARSYHPEAIDITETWLESLSVIGDRSIIALGKNYFMGNQRGSLSLPLGAQFYRGRIYGVSTENGDYEGDEEPATGFLPAMYSLEKGLVNAWQSIVLQPSDYTDILIEELARFSIDLVENTGQLMVSYARNAHQGDVDCKDNPEINLFQIFNSSGTNISDRVPGWSICGDDSQYAVFFNLDPGLYTVTALDSDRLLVSISTSLVDRDRMSMMDLGAKITPIFGN